MSNNTQVNTAVSAALALALADAHALTWPADQKCGRQGDVLIQRLDPADPRLDQAAMLSRTRRVDRVIARGSRAAHVASDEATVYEDPEGSLVVSTKPWALVHRDSPGDRHHPHILPEGAYLCTQQRELTASGLEQQVAD